LGGCLHPSITPTIKNVRISLPIFEILWFWLDFQCLLPASSKSFLCFMIGHIVVLWPSVRSIILLTEEATSSASFYASDLSLSIISSPIAYYLLEQEFNLSLSRSILLSKFEGNKKNSRACRRRRTHGKLLSLKNSMLEKLSCG